MNLNNKKHPGGCFLLSYGIKNRSASKEQTCSWLGRRDFRIASLTGLLPSAENIAPVAYIFGTSGTDPVGPHPRHIKKSLPKTGKDFFGWGGGIRTHEMQESKSCALPLGDAPICNYSKNAHSFYTMGVRLFIWGGGWDSNPRSSEPQSDALGQLRYIHHIGKLS